MLIELSCCSTKLKVINDSFCLLYEPPINTSKEILSYGNEIIEKMGNKNIETIEERFAEYIINHTSTNYIKYKNFCK